MGTLRALGEPSPEFPSACLASTSYSPVSHTSTHRACGSCSGWIVVSQGPVISVVSRREEDDVCPAQLSGSDPILAAAVLVQSAVAATVVAVVRSRHPRVVVLGRLTREALTEPAGHGMSARLNFSAMTSTLAPGTDPVGSLHLHRSVGANETEISTLLVCHRRVGFENHDTTDLSVVRIKMGSIELSGAFDTAQRTRRSVWRVEHVGSATIPVGAGRFEASAATSAPQGLVLMSGACQRVYLVDPTDATVRREIEAGDNVLLLSVATDDDVADTELTALDAEAGPSAPLPPENVSAVPAKRRRVAHILEKFRYALSPQGGCYASTNGRNRLSIWALPSITPNGAGAFSPDDLATRAVSALDRGSSCWDLVAQLGLLVRAADPDVQDKPVVEFAAAIDREWAGLGPHDRTVRSLQFLGLHRAALQLAPPFRHAEAFARVHATLALARELLCIVLSPVAKDILAALDAVYESGPPFAATDASAEAEVFASLAGQFPAIAEAGGCLCAEHHGACYPEVARRVYDCAIFVAHLLQHSLCDEINTASLGGSGPCSLRSMLQRMHGLLFLVLRSKEYCSGADSDRDVEMTKGVFVAVHTLLGVEARLRSAEAASSFSTTLAALHESMRRSQLGAYYTKEAFDQTLQELTGITANKVIEAIWALPRFKFGGSAAVALAQRSCDDEWDACTLACRKRDLAERGELERRCTVCNGVTASAFLSGDPRDQRWKPYPLSAAWSHSCPCGGAWSLRSSPLEQAIIVVAEREPSLK